MTPQNTTSPFTKLSLAEKIDRVLTAWKAVAPEAKFGGMNSAEFTSAVNDSVASRRFLATNNANLKAAISTRNHADKVSAETLNRVVDAVRAEPFFGPDSSLYRAMGYVSASERKSASAPVPEGTPVPKKIKPSFTKRMAKIIAGWQQYAPNESFAGLALPQLIEATAPSLAARDAIMAAEASLKGHIAFRNNADRSTAQVIQRAVAGIKADPLYGPDCALYRALGYVPTSERKSRVRKQPTPPVESASA